MKLEMAAATDPGRVRAQNEDALYTQPEAGLAVLADGMGGHLAGDVASRIAVESIARHLQDCLTKRGRLKGNKNHAERLTEAVQLANREILETAEQEPDCAGMGATVVIAWFHDGHMSAAHLGDSRIYRARAGGIEQLTEDHSVAQELVREGLLKPEHARLSVARNLITQALGVDALVEPDITECALEAGDLYLLCTDGLSDVVSEGRIRDALAEAAPALERTAARLIDMANDAGGPDNVTVILVRVIEP